MAKYDFVGQADELTFTAGQVILDVRDTDTPNWMVGRIDGGPPGYFQRNYCKVETGVPPTGGVASLPKKNKGPKVAKTVRVSAVWGAGETGSLMGRREVSPFAPIPCAAVAANHSCCPPPFRSPRLALKCRTRPPRWTYEQTFPRRHQA